MSTAVQDATTENTEQKRWTMPRPCLGQCVRYYSKCIMSERNAEIGFIAEMGERVVGIAVRGTIYDNVFHKDDPRILNNTDLKNEIDGLWEATEADLDMDIRVSYLEEQVQLLKQAKNKIQNDQIKPAAKLNQKTD